MRKIDIHTHILPDNLPDLSTRYGYDGFVALECHGGCGRMIRNGQLFREVDANCWQPEIRLAECQAEGVDIQVLSTVPVMFSYWAKPTHALELSKRLNDHIASVVSRYPENFLGLATVPLQDTELAIRELERATCDLGLNGVEIGTHVNDENLGSTRLDPFFAASQNLGAAIFVHPWDMMGQAQMQQYWLPWLVGMPAETTRAICSLIFSGVLERYPDLRIAFAHGGGSFPATLGRIQHGFEVRPDLCAVDNSVPPKNYARQIYYDSLVHDPSALRYLLDFAGENRVALGSDYPFLLGERPVGRLIESMDLSLDTKARLFHGTALEWLGLDTESFRYPDA